MALIFLLLFHPWVLLFWLALGLILLVGWLADRWENRKNRKNRK